MKTETKFVILFFAGCLACLMLAIRFTPTKQPTIEDILNADTVLMRHSEIKRDTLKVGEWTHRFDVEPRYLNED